MEDTITRSTNASSVLFGFDFQVNAAIVLMLENIAKLRTLRLEGATEDIELTMQSGKKIFAQAKSVIKASSDFDHVRAKTQKAISTLSKADGEDVEQLILITNSVNPLNERSSSSFFWGPPSDVKYVDLTEGGKKVINDIVGKLGINFDRSKFHIKFFAFETDNPSERYKSVLRIIRDFVAGLESARNISAKELMEIWQNDIFHNGSKADLDIKIDKKGLVWPIIVLAIGKNVPDDLLEDYDQGLADEISTQYSSLINNCVERYEMVTSVLYDYKKYISAHTKATIRENMRRFVDTNWKNYVDVLGLCSLNEELQKGISRIVLSKIIHQRYTVEAIKKEVAL